MGTGPSWSSQAERWVSRGYSRFQEPGRTSWTAVPDAVPLGPEDDEAEVTAAQVRGCDHPADRRRALARWRPACPGDLRRRV